MSSFRFKKKYGQNFLVDKNITNKIVDTINIKKNNLVIEIGTGSGMLTSKLCSVFDQVLGYEIDRELEKDLNNNLSSFSNYKIIFDDFLKRDIKKDLEEYNYDNLYIIANLPYYITTPIIEKITLENLDIELMRIMVQKEVGDRFSAKIGTKNYSSITVYLNYNYEVKKDFVVSRNSFIPKPNVDSLIVSFYKKDKFKLKNETNFYKLVRDSFKYKRKTLRNNLKEYDLEKIETVLKKYNYDLNTRAESLPLEVFCEISNSLN